MNATSLCALGVLAATASAAPVVFENRDETYSLITINNQVQGPALDLTRDKHQPQFGPSANAIPGRSIAAISTPWTSTLDNRATYLVCPFVMQGQTPGPYVATTPTELHACYGAGSPCFTYSPVAQPLAAGDTVGPALDLTPHVAYILAISGRDANMPPETFASPGEGQRVYVGLRLTLPDGLHYGWMEFTGPGFALTYWGYESEPDTPIQIIAPNPPGPCVADLNGDHVTNATDLAILLGSWGQSGGVADIDGMAGVNARDLAILLGAWGPCL